MWEAKETCKKCGYIYVWCRCGKKKIKNKKTKNKKHEDEINF